MQDRRVSVDHSPRLVRDHPSCPCPGPGHGRAAKATRHGTPLVGYSIRVWIRDRSKIVKRRKINTTGDDYRESVVDYAVQE